MRTSIAPRFSVSSGSLPPGLSVSDEGLISGTPTAAGSYDFYLTVTYDKPALLQAAVGRSLHHQHQPGGRRG